MMKKLVAIMLAVMLVLAMVACDTGSNPDSSGNDNPGVSQSGENNDVQSGKENNDGEEADTGENTNNEENQGGANTAFTGYEWPVTDYLTAGMKWTGSGIVVKCEEASGTYRDTGVEYETCTMYVETATLDEVGTYIDSLKTEGFIYYTRYSDTDEPALEFDATKMYKWEGETSDGRFVKITLYSDELERGGYDREADREYTYKLEVVAYSVSPYTDPNQYTGN